MPRASSRIIEHDFAMAESDASSDLWWLVRERAADDVRDAVRMASACARRAAAQLVERDRTAAALALAEAWSAGQCVDDELYAVACRLSGAAERAFVTESFHAACALRAAASVVWAASAAARGLDADLIDGHLDSAIDAAIKAVAVENAPRAPAPALIGGAPVLFRDVGVDGVAVAHASLQLLRVVPVSCANGCRIS